MKKLFAKQLRIRGKLHRQKLERGCAIEFEVLSFVDDAHAAFAKFLDDFIVGDGLADHEIIKILITRAGFVDELPSCSR